MEPTPQDKHLEETAPDETAETGEPAFKNSKERLYDKVPMSYKQMDIVVKILVVLTVLALIAGIASGR